MTATRAEGMSSTTSSLESMVAVVDVKKVTMNPRRPSECDNCARNRRINTSVCRPASSGMRTPITNSACDTCRRNGSVCNSRIVGIPNEAMEEEDGSIGGGGGGECDDGSSAGCHDTDEDAKDELPRRLRYLFQPIQKPIDAAAAASGIPIARCRNGRWNATILLEKAETQQAPPPPTFRSPFSS